MKENIKDRKGEQGSAMVIAILIMALMSIFVAVALARVTTESMIMGNESDEQKTTYAAQASLETMTRNFDKVFDVHLTPTDDDLTKVKNGLPPGFTTFTFAQDIISKGKSKTVNLTGGTYQGLNALQDPWQIQTTATSSSGQQVMLTRDFLNNRIPIFQFGMFFDGDLEVASGSDFSFGGRVHTNGNLYMRGGGDTYFDSRVSASKEIVVDVARNGWKNAVTTSTPSAAGFGDNIYIKDNKGVYQQLKVGMGSVTNGPDVAHNDDNVPDGDLNSNWKATNLDTNTDWTLSNDVFGGNLIAKAKKLELPLKLGGGALNNIEMIKRGRQAGDFEATKLGRAVDNQIVSISRFSNKPGIRVSLADSQAELPGGTGGARLDGASTKPGAGVAWGSADADGTRGYKPLAMTDGYQATRMNGHRLYTGKSYPDNGTGCPATGCTATMPDNRETWIKVEIVTIDTSSLLPSTQDITEDFLSLGLTEKAPDGGNDFKLKTTGANSYVYTGTTATDSRAILKMQRFVIPGTPIRDDNSGNPNPTIVMSSPKVVHNEEGGPINYDAGTNPPVPELGPSYYFVRWTGQIKTTTHSSSANQTYKFKVTVNDGARLWVNGTLVIDSWTDKTSTASPTGTISLAPDTKYDIKLEYYQAKNTDGAVAKLYWSRTTGPAMAEVIVPVTNLYAPGATTANGLKGEYYTSAYTYIPNNGYSCVTDDDFMLTNEEKAGIGVNLEKLNGLTSYQKAIPFPIEMFDAREGLDNEFYGSNSAYNNTGAVPYLGVMSMIDIDVANLRSFLNGSYDTKFPTTTAYATAKGAALKGADIPKDNGWVMYVSDRRGDRDFDGQFDMEDVYGPVKADGSLDATHTGPNDGALQTLEDINLNKALDVDYLWEATKYRESSVSTDRVVDPTQIVQPTTTTQYISTNSDLAAIFDHKYYRRGVRLINGSQLPGDKNNGFTLASENGVYISGNYNATGVASHGTPTADTGYQPDSTGGQVPASVVADAVTIISNAPTSVGGAGWTDGTSFRKPDDSSARLPRETTVRTALLMGNSISGIYNDTINQGGLYSQNLNGMISNFKRFLERWNGTYLNYCGSLINLFNSQNNVGTFKYGSGTVYSAPTRNWVFDSSFLDPTRLPPGTPFFQFVQMTGFRRMNT